MTRGRWRRWVTLAFTVVSCSACRVDATVDVAVTKEGTGTVTVTVTADADLLKRAPDAAKRLRVDDLQAAGWKVDGPTATADGGRSITLNRPFANPDEAVQILDQLSGPQGPVTEWQLDTVRANGVTVTTFGGRFRLVGSTSAFADDKLVELLGDEPLRGELTKANTDVARSFGLAVSVALPGRTDQPLAWSADFAGAAGTEAGQPFNVTTEYGRSTALADRIDQVAPWAIASWLALIGLVVAPIAWLIGRRRARGLT